MSYCRFGDDDGKSDVYMYRSRRGIECSACHLPSGSTPFNNRMSALAHLKAHEAYGHYVPNHAFEDLHAEVARFGWRLIEPLPGEEIMDITVP